MKYYCVKSDFKNTWDEVVSAFWQRYPNPYSSHVLCEDTVFRNVVGNKLITKRIFIKTTRIPKWGERFISCKQVPVLEESVVDRDSQKLITYTRNISYARLMSIEEKCIYQADPMNSQCTILTREAWFKCNLKGFASAIQRLSLERFKHHANNANKGLQFVIAKMLSARQNQVYSKSECWVGEEAKPESMMYKHLSVYSRILHDIRISIINHCCLLIDGRIASPSQVRFEGQKATARSELPEQWQLDKKDQAKALLCVMTRSREEQRNIDGESTENAAAQG
ncbi:PRELI domain-containing protein 1, mitochondrial [Trichinella sp. T9]|nr:PRELI domain-containing protein 1, mitochondrial [Trichinella sp. T9]